MLEERRAARKKEQRALLVAKRQRAMKSSLAQAPKFFNSQDILARAWRTALAKKFLSSVTHPPDAASHPAPHGSTAARAFTSVTRAARDR